MAQELNVLALIKGKEHYVYIYDDGSAQPLLDTLQVQAADPQLSLTSYDAAVLTQKVGEQIRSAKPSSRITRVWQELDETE